MSDETALNAVRSNLDAIVIRAEEGDPKSDWLPIIARLAREAIATLDAARASVPGLSGLNVGRDGNLHCAGCDGHEIEEAS